MRCRKQLHAPGLLLCGDGAGMVNIPTLKGVHYAIESGRLAAEAAFAFVKQTAAVADALASYDDAVRSSFIWSDLHEVRDMRHVFGRGFFVGAALAGAMSISKGRISVGKLRTEPDDTQPLLQTDRADRYPVPDGKLTFDKLSSVFAAGNRTPRRSAQSHPAATASAARRRGTVGAHVPGGRVRRRRRGRRRSRHGGHLAVELRAVRRDLRRRAGASRPPKAGRARSTT